MEDIKTNPQLTKINELQQQLKLSGYNSYDIKLIIKDEITGNLEDATSQQLTELIQTLEGYITFANKCKKSK